GLFTSPKVAVTVALSGTASGALAAGLSVNRFVAVCPGFRVIDGGRPVSARSASISSASVAVTAMFPTDVSVSVAVASVPGVDDTDAGSIETLSAGTAGTVNVTVGSALSAGLLVLTTCTSSAVCVPGDGSPVVGRKQMPTSAVSPAGTDTCGIV